MKRLKVKRRNSMAQNWDYTELSKAAKAEKMILIQEEGANPSCLPYAIDRKENDLT